MSLSPRYSKRRSEKGVDDNEYNEYNEYTLSAPMKKPGGGVTRPVRKNETMEKLLIFVAIVFVAFSLTHYSLRPSDYSYMNETAPLQANRLNGPGPAKPIPSTPSSSPSFAYDDILHFDEVAMQNVRATFEGGRSWLRWATETILDVTIADKIDTIQALPLLATVDRRPISAKKQMAIDKENFHSNGELLGCAVSATTFVSKVENLYLDTFKDFTSQCQVCFQFSNRHDMNAFVPGVGFEPISNSQESTATKCFGGLANNAARFINWQSKDDRFKGFGYPFTVDCMLPNGIKELTCREITRAQNTVGRTDDLQAVYLQTRFTLDGYFGDPFVKTFHVFSRWPWAAVQSHDDDRSKIAKSLPKTWNDKKSNFVPSSVDDLKLLHIEGPGYVMGEYANSPTLESVHTARGRSGGLHFRLLVNLFHLARNAPQSTHMLAVVDGQARTSHEALKKLLLVKLSDIYASYGNVFTEKSWATGDMDTKLIPTTAMKGKTNDKSINSSMTLGDLLRFRGIKIHMIPVTSPSLSFEKSVCGGQYTFAAYVAARFAADYHVMMYVDGDTAMIEGSKKSLREILYNRFFSPDSSKCAGHRLRLIEQFVKPEDDKILRVLQCTEDISSNDTKWKYINQNCHLKEGHIVARTDSILAMSIHHPDTDSKYVPEGVEDCITGGNKENDRYFLKADEFVQVHLRNRLRKDDCVCFTEL